MLNNILCRGEGAESRGFLSIWLQRRDARLEIADHPGSSNNVSIYVGEARLHLGSTARHFEADVGSPGSGVRKPMTVEEWERGLPQCASGEDPVLASIEQDGGAYRPYPDDPIAKPADSWSDPTESLSGVWTYRKPE